MQEASVERCLEQAAQHRRMAEKADDPELKAKLLRIARSYEELAEQIGLTQRRRPPASPPTADGSDGS